MGKRSKKEATSSSSTPLIILVIFVLALAARLIYLRQVSAMPTFNVPLIDSKQYDILARNLVYQGVMDRPFFWQGFFYPIYLSAVYLLTEGSLLWAKIFQIVLGSTVCVLVFQLGREIFDKRTGILAGVICAFYGPLIFFEAELLATGWASFLSVVIMLLLLKANRKGKVWIYLTIGICGGLSAITRANFLPFFVAAVLFSIFNLCRASKAPKEIMSSASAVAIGFLLITIPVAVLCHNKSGEFTFLPLSGPINLYIGNNPDPDETIMTRPGIEWRELTRIPMVQGSESGREDRAYYMSLLKDYALTQPGHLFKGLADKTLQFIGSRELPRNQDMYVSRKYSRFFSLLVWKAGGFGFPFGVLLPFSLLGIVIGRHRFPWPMALFLIIYPLSIILVFVSARYRTPVIPVLVIPAAFGFWGVVDMAKAQKRRSVMVFSAAVAVVALLSSIAGPFPAERHDYEAEMHTFLGMHYSKEGHKNKAIHHLTLAKRLDPGSFTAHRMLGLVLYDQLRIDEAVEQFEKAHELDPDSYLILYYLGAGLLSLGRTEEGIEALEQALPMAVAAREEILIVEIRNILDAEARKRQLKEER